MRYLLVLLLCSINLTSRCFVEHTNVKIESYSHLDKFYFNRVSESGVNHNYYGFIEINLDNYIRIKYNEKDDLYLINSYTLDDDNIYHINDDSIIFDVSNKSLSLDERIFYINSTINSRY